MKTQSFEPIVVTTTSDDRDILKVISQQLVSQNLAACVQISGPIESCYRWEGQVETSEEWLCVIKSTRQNFDKLESVVLKHHNYEQPQLIAIDIAAGSSGYLNWLKSILDQPGD